jgi:hypothetical protein
MPNAWLIRVIPYRATIRVRRCGGNLMAVTPGLCREGPHSPEPGARSPGPRLYFFCILSILLESLCIPACLCIMAMRFFLGILSNMAALSCAVILSFITICS